MKHIILVILMVVFAYQAAWSADPKEHEPIISWRYQRNGEGERETRYLAGGAAMRFYWNDEFLGIGSVGLAAIYDRLKSFEGKSVKFVSRPRAAEDDKYLMGPDYMDNPLERDDAFLHFYQLLRKKNVNFTIEFKDDPNEPRYGGPNYNPFREKK